MNKLTPGNTSALCVGTAALLALSLSAPAAWAGTSPASDLPVSNAVQQTIQITGKVIDNTGMPIIGANVVIKGTTNGTITDMDGNFTLDGAAGSVLSISYVGFTEQTITVTDSKPLLMFWIGRSCKALLSTVATEPERFTFFCVP